MKCPLCGLEFQREEGARACGGCPLSRGCKMIRCPNCGYEIVPESGLVKLFKSWRNRHGTGREG